MATKHRTGIIARKPYDSFGNTVQYDLPEFPHYVVTKLHVWLRGSIIFSGGTASGASQGENPAGLVSQIRVDVNAKSGSGYKSGQKVLLRPRDFAVLRLVDQGRSETDTTVAGAAATYTLNTRFTIPFSIPRAQEPIESALRRDAYDQVQISIDNAAAITDMLSGNDRAVDVSGLYFEFVPELEYVDDIKGAPYMPPFDVTVDSRLVQIEAANAEFQLDKQLANAQGESYVDLALMFETTSQAKSDAILNRIEVFSNEESLGYMYEEQLNLERNDLATEAGETMTGLYYYPLVQGMRRFEGKLLGALPNVRAVLDVSNPGADRFFVISRRCRLRAA